MSEEGNYFTTKDSASKKSNPKDILMEKRIGAALILVGNRESVGKLNQILSAHADVIVARQGLPLHERGISIISLVLEGTTDEIGALTGPIGKLDGVQVKTLMLRG
ncbi:MAG: TM1266 family iron-only hydrogenase system putative regulator [Bacteroidales bacterium]